MTASTHFKMYVQFVILHAAIRRTPSQNIVQFGAENQFGAESQNMAVRDQR